MNTPTEEEDKWQRTPKENKERRIDSIFVGKHLPRIRVDKERHGKAETATKWTR